MVLQRRALNCNILHQCVYRFKWQREYAKNSIKLIERDKLWIEQLPSQIVLDDWRLVHAGYDPNVDLDCQTDSELLHVGKPFHRAAEPIDVHRTILFGHSITITLPGLE